MDAGGGGRAPAPADRHRPVVPAHRRDREGLRDRSHGAREDRGRSSQARHEYYYRFIDASGDVIEGRFETAARPGTHDGFHFGVISDAHGAEFAPFVAIKNAADANLDLLVKLGDQIHADEPAPGAMTLAEFRAEHNDIYSAISASTISPTCRRPHRSCRCSTTPSCATTGPAARARAPIRASPARAATSSTRRRSTATRCRRSANYNAIENHTYRHTGDDRFDGAPDLYRYNTYGSDASIIMLDARSFRDAEVPSPVNPLDPAECSRSWPPPSSRAAPCWARSSSNG